MALSSTIGDLSGLDEEVRLDLSSKTHQFVLTTAGGRRVRVSDAAWRTLRILKAGGTMAQAADELGIAATPEERSSFERAMESVLAVVARARDPRSIELPFGFWGRRSLISSRTVRAISARLVWLFTPRLGAILALVAVGIAAAILTAGKSYSVFGGRAIALSYSLFLISLVSHEFGHATACAAFGTTPSDIGFTVYLFYPSLYSDVSSCWGLSRAERVVVDLAGFYFQFLFGALYAALYWLTGWAPLRGALELILLTAAVSLNPAFRFDGYWVVADLLGVQNLPSEAAKLAKRAWARTRGRPMPASQWPPYVLWALLVYGLAAGFMWGGFAYEFGPQLRSQAVQLTVGARVLIFEAKSGHIPPGAAVEFIMSTAFVILMLGLIGQLLRRLLQLAGTRLRSAIGLHRAEQIVSRPGSHRQSRGQQIDALTGQLDDRLDVVGLRK